LKTESKTKLETKMTRESTRIPFEEMA
jgi:hypothetical protein